jgi:hypothetical protein
MFILFLLWYFVMFGDLPWLSFELFKVGTAFQIVRHLWHLLYHVEVFELKKRNEQLKTNMLTDTYYSWRKWHCNLIDPFWAFLGIRIWCLKFITSHMPVKGSIAKNEYGLDSSAFNGCFLIIRVFVNQNRTKSSLFNWIITWFTKAK